ncbi:hypothetical protein BC941DRAFT_465434 [Chlamydoabsidia padenii]|nr:hypothetical protein BC941DRAFT_465434 [Chlamydoabsidia padenii]
MFFVLATTLILTTETTTLIHAMPITSPTTTLLDIQLLTQHLSNQLLFDHIEPLVFQVSQSIATTFRTSMTLHSIPHHEALMVTQQDTIQDVIPVDLDLLLGQLQGAVGSFLEDKLPGLWNRQLIQIDRTTLQTRLETRFLTTCSSSTTCLIDSLDEIERDLIQHELTPAWLAILHTDLPILFHAAQTQVHGVLSLFDPPPLHTYQLTWHTPWQDMEGLLMEHWITLINNHQSSHDRHLVI